jgi:hypothetical protein
MSAWLKSKLGANVRLWRKADQQITLADVRFRRNSERD